MAYETLRYIHIASAALAALALLVSAVVFIALDIPKAAGSVTGLAAKRGAGKIRARNARRERAKPSPVAPQPYYPPQRRAGADVTAALPAPAGRDAPARRAESAGAAAFEVEYDITYIHTDEAIAGRGGERA
ncbi:MAG: hypothetical protein LBD49_02230 [Oscillospiraceae bacterium]|nr:hypothetical protein [Oscillospiraceae bacterium]